LFVTTIPNYNKLYYSERFWNNVSVSDYFADKSYNYTNYYSKYRVPKHIRIFYPQLLA